MAFFSFPGFSKNINLLSSDGWVFLSSLLPFCAKIGLGIYLLAHLSTAFGIQSFQRQIWHR